MLTQDAKTGYVSRPAKGLMYLEDVENGDFFETSGLRGIKLDSGAMGTRVIITKANVEEEDQNYYLGKHMIANTTEVRKR